MSLPQGRSTQGGDGWMYVVISPRWGAGGDSGAGGGPQYCNGLGAFEGGREVEGVGVTSR